MGEVEQGTWHDTLQQGKLEGHASLEVSRRVLWSVSPCSCQDSFAPDYDDDHLFRRTLYRSSFDGLTDEQWRNTKHFIDRAIDEAVGQILPSDFGRTLPRNGG